METVHKKFLPVNVLLVDDKEENLYSLESLLEDDKLKFIKTTSGYDALKIALNEDIGVILLDVQMPEIDGYEVARLLKENNKTKNIPVIFVTALNQEPEHVLQGYEQGAVDYLFKPLNPEITKAKVNAFILMYLQQKELEHQTITLEALALLVNNSADLMCIMDRNDLEIITANPAWESTLDFKTDEIIGSSFTDFLSDHVIDLKKFLSNKLQENEHVVKDELTFCTKNGKLKTFDWSFVFKNGKWYANAKDISDRKEAEEKLNKAYEDLEEKVAERTKQLSAANEKLKNTNKDLDHFVYVASHDLKLPIANMEGLHRTLAEELKDQPEVVSGIVKMFGQSIAQLKDTIHELINIIQTPKQEEKPQKVSGNDCKKVLDEILISIRDLVEEQDARILSEFNGCDIYFPRANFKSILYNLITNALKYRSDERKPVVEVKLKKESDEPSSKVLTVKDNGRGISQDNLKKLFAKFQRLEKEDKVEGTGIGLYIVKSTVEKYGGQIEVNSKEGEGTEFKVHFN